jgi:hypothetical protein
VIHPNAPYVTAKILGPLALFSGAALFSQTGRMIGVIDAVMVNDGLMMGAGFLSMLGGLIVLAFASSWRSFTEIIITLMGWLSLVRGIIVIFAPAIVHGAAIWLTSNPAIMSIAGGVLALLGLWLCFQGFFTTHVPDNEQLVDNLR